MGGFLGIGGSSTKADRANVIDSEGYLRNLFNYGLPAGQGQETTGNTTLSKAMSQLGVAQNTVGQAGDYFGKIVSGDRTAVLGAVQPVTENITAATDAQARQEAEMGTARGGGTNAENQALQERKMAATDTAIASARPEAARGELAAGQTEAGIGATEGGIGSMILQNAMQLLGLSSGAASNLGELALNSQRLNFQQQQATGQAIGQLLLMGLAL